MWQEDVWQIENPKWKDCNWGSYKFVQIVPNLGADDQKITKPRESQSRKNPLSNIKHDQILLVGLA